MACADGPCLADAERVVLADGATAVVRPLRRGDGAAVADVFESLSERSRRQRFGASKSALTAAELAALAAIQCGKHEAVVAYDPASEHAVGIARFVRDEQDPAVAEVAYEVADEWQGRRLGSRLLELVACRAREVGIRLLRGEILADNAASQAVLRRIGRVARTRYDGPLLRLDVSI